MNDPRSPVAVVASAVFAIALTACKPAQRLDSVPLQNAGPITFTRDIAPILFQHCAPCHRPGQSAPFSLLTYSDAQKHASDLVKVTRRRFMPPWLPEPGFGEFANERKLSADQIRVIQDWVNGGAAEGDAADLPKTPQWSEGWHLGKPDLVLQLPQPYSLSSDGKDVYRNFVVPIPVRGTRFVQAIEFLPNSKSVHHARLMIDQTGQCRHLEELDPEPGFEGMRAPAKFPPGHILSWVPGKVPVKEPDGLPWILEEGTDLVIQLHLQRTGKTESIRPVIGLYFTDKPPTKAGFLIGLVSMQIDIPAGEKNYEIKRTFELPVDVDALDVLPHLHYLGRELRAFAKLPDGTTKWLFSVKQWDFNWQGDYQFANPVFLPAGSVLTMEYFYDNSVENIRNPSHPPRRVTYGPQSTDEMGELWIQVVPRNPNDLVFLQQEQRLWGLREFAGYYESLLGEQPNNATAHYELGKTLGPLGRSSEAKGHFLSALRLDPKLWEARYFLGLIYLDAKQLSDARTAFEEVLKLNSSSGKAHDGLGLVCLAEEKLEEAQIHFKEALRLNPEDPMAAENLARIRQAKVETKTKN